MASAHEELHSVIDLLDNETADSILKIIKKLVNRENEDDNFLTPHEIKRMKRGEAQISKGEFITIDDYSKERY